MNREFLDRVSLNRVSRNWATPSPAFIQYLLIRLEFTKLKGSKNYIVLCKPSPKISFTVKKLKFQIKIMLKNYLTIKIT